jgi:hypothetical protein
MQDIPLLVDVPLTSQHELCSMASDDTSIVTAIFLTAEIRKYAK